MRECKCENVEIITCNITKVTSEYLYNIYLTSLRSLVIIHRYLLLEPAISTCRIFYFLFHTMRLMEKTMTGKVSGQHLLRLCSNIDGCDILI